MDLGAPTAIPTLDNPTFYSSASESKPPKNATSTITVDGSHDKESEALSQHKAQGGPPAAAYPSEHWANVSTTPAKRKTNRASQACYNCRQVKAKCDETKPCRACRDKGTECRYRDPTHKPSDPNPVMDQILDEVGSLQDDLKKLVQCLPAFIPTRGHQPAPIALEEHLSYQEPIAIPAAQREVLKELEASFTQLRKYDNWDILGPRLAWYASSLCRYNDPGCRPELVGEDDRGIAAAALPQPMRHTMQSKGPQNVPQSGSQSRASPGGRLSPAEFEASSVGLKRKRSSSLHNEPIDKPFFCFHESCGRTYGYRKTLENHIRNYHHGKLPNLPGTCKHGPSTKRFSTWEDCLDHFIYHQENGMSQEEYDGTLETAEYSMSHDNQQVNTKQAMSSPSASLIGGSPLSYGYSAQQLDSQSTAMCSNGPRGAILDLDFSGFS